MRSERLVVLLSPTEKKCLAALAHARHVSIGELVRSALADLTRPQPDSSGSVSPADHAPTWPGPDDAPQGHDGVSESINGPASLSADQVAALDRLAETALATMRRANSALDRAFAEVAATKAHFAAQRRDRASA